eukprot:gene2756-2933_t
MFFFVSLIIFLLLSEPLSLYSTTVASRSFDEEWVESQNLQKWLTPIDLCIIQDTRNVSTDIILRDCEAKVAQEKKDQVIPPLRCRIGNTWPSRSRYCDAEDIPFSQRFHFKSVPKTLDHPEDNALKTFFSHLIKKNGALLLIGDSVTQQMFNAIACELVRENVWTDYNTFTNTDEVQYVTMSQIDHKNQETPLQQSALKFLPVYHFVDGRHDRRPQQAFHSLVTTLQDFLSKYNTLYIVINMGLHYIDNPAPGFSKNDYSKQMEKLLLYLHSFHQNYTNTASSPHHHSLNGKPYDIKIIWRETSAQHFSLPNGYWPGIRYIRGMKLKCSPLQETSIESDWRNYEISNLIRKHHLTSSIHLMPFYNITIPLWSQHPNGQMKDCTHFCWTPMLFQSFFHYLKNMILSSP